MLSLVYGKCHLCRVSHINKLLILIVIMLNAILLSAVKPSVVAPLQ
jgi:hypothetical protein